MQSGHDCYHLISATCMHNLCVNISTRSLAEVTHEVVRLAFESSSFNHEGADTVIQSAS
jgi:hypothetical protein